MEPNIKNISLVLDSPQTNKKLNGGGCYLNHYYKTGYSSLTVCKVVIVHWQFVN